MSDGCVVHVHSSCTCVAEWAARRAAHAALQATGGLVETPIEHPSGGVLLYDGMGALRVLPARYRDYQGVTRGPSSCPHTMPFSYQLCRACAAELVAAVDAAAS